MFRNISKTMCAKVECELTTGHANETLMALLQSEEG